MPDSTRFGRYEVEEEVARGGMGVIYRVRDPQMRRFLAMKVLLTEEGDGNAEAGSRHSNLSARFTDEAQLTGQLDHPGIIPVYDMGHDEDGRLFFTMRLVKGRTLEQIFELVHLGQEGWTVTRALGVLQKVCEALAFAHDRGVIHRDVKPANVMVGRFGETYVMDWGLAKLVDEEQAPIPEEQSSIRTVLTSARKDESSRGGDLATMEGDVMGTPAYMAPEQARGQVHRVGPRSDVYALGAMLYHLLTGHAPFRPAGDSATGRKVLDRLLAGPPPDVESMAAHVPPELCAICDRAMARDPDERYASMLEVAEELQAYVENRVVQAYRRGALVEFKKWVQRNRAIAASLLAVISLVIGGLASVSYIQTRARDEVQAKNRELAATNIELEAERERTAEARDRAERNRDRAERNRERALESEEIALASEQEALWQSYVGNIGAAYAALEFGSASEARRRLAACPEALRDWEWRYLDQRADGSLRVLEGSETFVTTLAVSPTSPRVAAAGGMQGSSGIPDYAIRVWDVETGELEQRLQGHDDTVASLAFSPAGDTLASASVSGNLRLWDIASGALISEESGLGSRIAYHPEGRLIATASLSKGSVQLWDSYDQVTVKSRTLPTGTNALRFSPDGRFMALAGKDSHIRILDLQLETTLNLDASGEARDTSSLVRIAAMVGPGVYSLDFSPDGQRLVSGSDDHFVRIWDLATGTRLHLLAGHASAVLAVGWHPRFPWIVSSDRLGSIRFWDTVTGHALDTLRGHDEDVHALAFTPLGDRMFSASGDRTVRVWDGQAGASDTILEGYGFPNFRPYRLAFSPDGERVVWRRGENTFTVTDVRTGEDVCASWITDRFSNCALAFSEDGIWDCEATGMLARWDPETGKESALVDSGWLLTSGAFQSSERSALVGGYPREGAGEGNAPGLKKLDLSSGKALWSIALPLTPYRIKLSTDGGRCLVVGPSLGGQGVGILCFDAASGAQLWEVWSPVRCFDVLFFPDGTRIAHTTYNEWDSTLYIRDAETGALLEQFIGHAQPATLGISPDGARIVSGNWDGTLSVWSPDRGEILALPAHTGNTTSVGFSPDGKTIASLGNDGRRRLWNSSPVESRLDARDAAARRRRWSVDARQRVDELLATRVHASAVVEALEADPELRPEQRAAAILLVRSEGSSLEGIIERSFTISLDPRRPGAEYMAALEGAKEVAAQMRSLVGLPQPQLDVMGPLLAQAHIAVGAAQLRLGLSHEALASLGRADRSPSMGRSWDSAVRELLKAIAHHRLGDVRAAGLAYERGLAGVPFGGARPTPEMAHARSALELEVRVLLGRY